MLTPQTLHAALERIHRGKLSTDDAATIMALAHVVVDAKGQQSLDAIRFFAAISHVIFMLTGDDFMDTPAFAPDADELGRIRSLGGKLSTIKARELAYATAHLLITFDKPIAPDDKLVETLRTALGITKTRVDELAAQLSSTN